MSLIDWIKAPLVKIKEFLLPKIEVGGFSILETIRQNRENTRLAHNSVIERAVKNNWPVEELDSQLEKMQKARRVHTLTTYKNIGAAVRGHARSLLAIGRKGRFYNVSVLDEKTTHVCLGYVGQSWPKPYSAIPEKPPRTQRLIHRCRSYLEFRGSAPSDTRSFIQQFRDGDDEFKREMLGPRRFEAYKSGKLPINSYAQYEKSVLYTLEELNIN